MATRTYALASGVEMSKQVSGSRKAPTEDEIRAVKAGDYVLLRFEWAEDGTCYATHIGNEGLWVQVTGAGKVGGLVGVLHNEPLDFNAPVKWGDTVRFRREHILCIDTKSPTAEAPSPLLRLAIRAVKRVGRLLLPAH